MGNFLIGSFYTCRTPYEQIIEEYLKKSCNKFNLDLFIVATDNQGSWSKNVAQKPRVILDMLETLEDNINLVFLDADSTIEQELKLFHEVPDEFDLALHYLDWNTWYQNGSDVKELLSGTLFFRNNERVKSLVREWADKASTSQEWEQKILEKILKKRTDIKVFELPIEYCYIKTMPNGQEPFVKCNPVILHHQVSRKMKRIIK